MQIHDGDYISAGDKKLFLRVMGGGSPTVIFEPGFGSLSPEWMPIAQEIAKNTQVVLYDRAGYGESRKGKQPRTTRQISFELYDMLANAGIEQPYLLVGNGFGGLIVQNFAKMFPREIAGIVLADSFSADIDEIENIDAPAFIEKASLKARMNNIAKLTEMEKEEFEQHTAKMLQDVYNNFPKTIADMLFAYQTDITLYETILEEYEALGESTEIIRNIPDFPNVPLSVLCRDFKVMVHLAGQLGIAEEEARASEEIWLRHSKNLSELSTEGEFKIVKNSGSMMHLSRPDAIIMEIKKMLIP